jgi:hypothetical protein
MLNFNKFQTQVNDYFSKLDWIVILVRFCALAFIAMIYNVLMSFETLLKEYYFLGDNTIRYIFAAILILLLIIDNNKGSKNKT